MPISVEKKSLRKTSDISFLSKNEISAKLDLLEEEILGNCLFRV